MEEFQNEEMQQPEAPKTAQQPEPQAPQSNGGIDWGGDITRFFTQDIKDMFLAVIKRPATGAQKWLDETKSKSIVNPIFMVATSFVLLTLFSFIVLRIKIGSSVGFGTALAIGTTPIFFSLFTSLFMFIFLAIKQKPDIILAFRHSAIHVLLLTIAMVLILSTMLVFIDQYSLMGIMFQKVSKGLGFGFLLIMLISIYAISMGFSAARQTLKTCQKDDKEGYSWYIAPLVVFLSIYMTYLIVSIF